MSRFSRTVMPGKIPRPSGDWLSPTSTRSCAGTCVISLPSKTTRPARTFRRPDSVFIVVVLPAPLAPIRVTIDPSSTLKLMSRIASMWP